MRRLVILTGMFVFMAGMAFAQMGGGGMAMKEMSDHIAHMADGKMDHAMMQKMQDRMKNMGQMMEKMGTTGKEAK